MLHRVPVGTVVYFSLERSQRGVQTVELCCRQQPLLLQELISSMNATVYLTFLPSDCLVGCFVFIIGEKL